MFVCILLSHRVLFVIYNVADQKELVSVMFFVATYIIVAHKYL